MRLKHIYITSILLITILVFTACSKEARSPKLLVHVEDLNGSKIEGATVRAWPTDQNICDTTSSCIPNLGMDQTLLTDANGDVAFDFEFSAVLDIDVTYLKAITLDSTQELTGHRVVKIEVIEQREEDNIFEETIIIE